MAVQYRNYYTRPAGLYDALVDGDERPWVVARNETEVDVEADAEVARNGRRLMNETWRLYEGRWTRYKRANVTFVPYQVAYDKQTKRFVAPNGVGG